MRGASVHSPVDRAGAPQAMSASGCETPLMAEHAMARDLAQVAESVAPAQQAEARRLLALLGETPDDVDSLAAARHLVDAYLHDPYLERG